MSVHVESWIAPPGWTSVFVRCYAGGASGQGGSGPGGGFFGAGGGGGAFAAAVKSVVPGLDYTVVWSDAPPVVVPPSGADNGGDASFGTNRIGTTVLAAKGNCGTFPGEAGGLGGTAADSTGDYKQSGFDGQPGGFANQPGGDGGAGAPPEGGAGGTGNFGDGTDGSIPSGGGGAGGSTVGGGSRGGAGTPGGIVIWNNTNGTGNGPTNTPPMTSDAPVIFGTGAPPVPPVNPKNRKGAFIA